MTAKLKGSALRLSEPKRSKAATVRPRGMSAGSALAQVFVERATDAVLQIAQRLDESALQRAVAAPTNAGALARAVSATAAFVESEAVLDPLADLIARGAEQKREILERAGGALSVSQVAQLLRLTRQAVDKRRRESKLLAIHRGDGFAYPACQFEKNRVVPGLTPILELIGDQEWVALEFLITPQEELEELTPLDVLRGKDPALQDHLLRLARIIAAGDGFG